MKAARTIFALCLAFAAPALADEPRTTLGNDLTGASCSLGPSSGSLLVLRTTPILCGEKGASAGALYAAPFAAPASDDPAARRQALLAAARAMPGGLGRGDDLTCDNGAPLAPDGQAFLFSCTQVSDGWPRIVLLVAAGATAFQGEGLPAVLPVLEAAISNTGGRVLSAAETETAVRVLNQHFPGALAHAGGADAASDAALIELARLAAAHNDYGAAEASYRRALEIETRIFGDRSLAVGQTLMELALQVSNQTRFEEAQGLFDRAQPIIDASGNLPTRARLQSYLALHEANQRHFADALKFAAAATEMRRQELNGNAGQGGADTGEPQAAAGRGELAHSLRIEAAMAMKLGDLPTALAAADEVLKIVADEPSLPLWWRPDSVAMMADINAQEGRVVEAERQYRDALVMDQKLFGDTAPTAYAELRLGKFYSDQQLYPAALEVFRLALGILDRDETARASIQSDQIIPFLATGSALAAENGKDRAQLEGEMFRASQLLSSDVEGRTIARAAARLASQNAPLAELMRAAQDAQRARDEARIALAAETAKPDDQRDAKREEQLAAEVLAEGQKAVQLTQQIETTFPDYRKLADPGPVALAELESRLGEHEAFLSFVVGTGGSYALLVTHGGMTVAHLDETRAKLADDVGELRKALVPRVGGLLPFDLEASYELYSHLLAPLRKELDAVDHLIVAPAGALASFPLELLVTEQPRPGASYAEASWLVRRIAVSEIPSPEAFLTLRDAAAKRVAAPRPLLAVADPAFTGPGATGSKDPLAALTEACRSEGPMPPDLIRSLPPLHETAGEVRTVAKLLGAGDESLLLGIGATEAAFRAEPLDQFRVLYFATHGLLPGELHCQTEPGLVLSPPAQPASSTANDGLLEASEIAGLKLNADLVVLSACNTAASGGSFGGEALAGLADAFFNAGARTVLASNWEVPSLSTAKLMTQLFQNLTASPDAGLADALRQAELTLLRDRDTAHPFFWGAFDIIGDGGGVKPLAPADSGARPRQPT